jgi:protein TonB
MVSARPITTPLRWALATALGLGLAACSKPAPAPTAPAAEAAAAAAANAQAAVQAAAAQQAAALAALSADELKARGRQALREQRIYSPAGNNAMEYYIALRKKSAKPDASAESALMDLQPYAVIAAEQALTKEDFNEAERLRGLIASADPQAPSLARIGDAITRGRAAQLARASTAVTDEAARVAAEDAAKARADAKLKADALAAAAARSAPPAAVAQPAAPAPQPAAPPPSNPQPVATAPANPPPRPQPPPPSRPAPAQPSGELVAVSAPQPVFPPEARRSHTSGAVTVSFTVNADGSVSNVDVVNARPRGVFERSVQNAVRKWRFQPMSSAQNVTRTFDFAP